ncbi:MAG: RNA polymerase sigma factor [Myxococcota bacterium]|nr:RNA polymerase sigma factor [Myxococcota bacterium]
MSGRVITLNAVEVTLERPSDEALLHACAQGDTHALGVLFDNHHRAVYRFIHRLSYRAGDDVDDLVQTTFLRVHENARAFHGRSAVRTWIFGVAVNVVRRARRRRFKRRRIVHAMADVPRECGRPQDTAAQNRQAVRRLEVGLANLPDHLRECFVLCQLEGISGPEAAQALGLRLGTLYRRIHEARKHLREAVGDCL